MAIVKWQDFFAPNPQDINRENYLVFETDRQAEILDWLRCKNISTAEKDRFIHNLINFDDNCGGFYDFRAYFLAAKYIAVFPNSSFVDEIAEQLLDWSRGYFWCRKSKIDFNETISKEAEKALKALKTTGNSKAIAAYEQTIQNTQQDDLLISTAQKLLELDPNNKIAIATIKDRLLNSDSNSKLSYNKVVAYLIDLIYQDYQFQQKHRDRAEVVSNNGCYINLLGKMTQTNKAAREGLYFLLEKVRDEHSKLFIYLALPQVERSTRALNIINSYLKFIKDDRQQYNIARSILVQDPDNKVALNIYHRLLNVLDDKHSRLEIAKKLALSDSSNQLAINTLSELIYIPSLYNRLNEQELALPVLEQIDPSNKLAIKALEEFAKKTKDQDALIYIIKHLQRLDPGNDVAQRRLNDIIAAVISSMQTYDHYDDSSLLNILIYGRGIRSSQLLPEIVISLKPYLNHKGSTNREIACLIIWKCAKQLSYPDFYRAWHT